MQVFKGNRRLFESAITEDSTTTNNIRVIAIPGVYNLEEIINCSIPVIAYIAGTAGTTYIKINELEQRELKIHYGSDTPTPPSHSWIRKGQAYTLMYNGNYFIASGITSGTSFSKYNFNFLNDNPTTGVDISTYLSVSDFNNMRPNDTMYVYYDDKASNINSVILSTVEWTNTYAVGKSCNVKTIAFLDYSCNPVSIDICLGTDNIVYYGTTPGYDVT